MTTLSEYKAMMEGATDAPWVASKATYPDKIGGYDWAITVNGGVIIETFNKTGWVDIKNGTFIEHPADRNAQFIAASRNIAPSLIRVIELAEEALNNVRMHKCMFDDDNQFNDACDGVNNALSEIRKIKGE